MDTSGSASDVTLEDEAIGLGMLLDGSTAFGVHVEDVDLALTPIQGLGLSMLGWKLLQGGNMPTWVKVPPGEESRVHDHVANLALAPGFSGVVFAADDWRPVVDKNPQVTYVYVVGVDNVLASPNAGILGWHVRLNHLATRETVYGGDFTGTSVCNMRGWEHVVRKTLSIDVTDYDRFLLVTDREGLEKAGELLMKHRMR